MPAIFQLNFGIAFCALVFAAVASVLAAMARQLVRAVLYGIAAFILLVGIIFFLFVH